MASPFPGMDPYLERYWRDVHHRLVTYGCDQLQSRLPDDLIERIKAIRIPLRETDTDVPLDLQALVEQAYGNGRYELEIDYRLPPDPPFDTADGPWADELLRGQGRR
jgi:hypothetical protein